MIGWCMQALSTAMTVHHEVLRAQLNKYKGVEMQIDGDAVLLAFKDPVSAIAWCLATQQVGNAVLSSVTTCMSKCACGNSDQAQHGGSWDGFSSLSAYMCIN